MHSTYHFFALFCCLILFWKNMLANKNIQNPALPLSLSIHLYITISPVKIYGLFPDAPKKIYLHLHQKLPNMRLDIAYMEHLGLMEPPYIPMENHHLSWKGKPTISTGPFSSSETVRVIPRGYDCHYQPYQPYITHINHIYTIYGGGIG